MKKESVYQWLNHFIFNLWHMPQIRGSKCCPTSNKISPRNTYKIYTNRTDVAFRICIILKKKEKKKQTNRLKEKLQWTRTQHGKTQTLSSARTIAWLIALSQSSTNGWRWPQKLTIDPFRGRWFKTQNKTKREYLQQILTEDTTFRHLNHRLAAI